MVWNEERAALIFSVVSVLAAVCISLYCVTCMNHMKQEIVAMKMLHQLGNVEYKLTPELVFEEQTETDISVKEAVATVPEEDEAPTPDPALTVEEMNLIALVVMAEAEGETELGKRLVIDTILNRVDDARFPDTVYDVVYQANQFSSMWNGRANRCTVQDDILQLVKEELLSRTNREVMFFNAGHYSAYGVPMFQECCHYFSKFEA